jgi:hypothetical protein
MLSAEIIAPALEILITVVAPYLIINLPPDSSIVKLVVANLVALVAFVALDALPLIDIGQVPVALEPDIAAAPIVL